jgi:hypothetical protein
MNFIDTLDCCGVYLSEERDSLEQGLLRKSPMEETETESTVSNLNYRYLMSQYSEMDPKILRLGGTSMAPMLELLTLSSSSLMR